MKKVFLKSMNLLMLIGLFGLVLTGLVGCERAKQIEQEQTERKQLLNSIPDGEFVYVKKYSIDDRQYFLVDFPDEGKRCMLDHGFRSGGSSCWDIPEPR